MHICASVEDGNLVFETSHFKKCDKPYCTGTHHILNRELYTNLDVVNQELADLFRRPVQERSED
jgi:CheY-like chemotaxis protein